MVVHKTSKITDCEADGFLSAVGEERVDTTDLISMGHLSRDFSARDLSAIERNPARDGRKDRLAVLAWKCELLRILSWLVRASTTGILVEEADIP